MAQITHGVWSIMSHPVVYSLSQRIMGGRESRERLVNDFIRPRAAMRVLDLGCGPADILAYLPDIDYWGFDISDAYIRRACARFGHRGKFHCRELVHLDIKNMPPFDIVLVLGVLHHLEDAEAVSIMRLAYKALKRGGRLVTFDPCLETGQNPIARFLIGIDRGRRVRTEAGYTSIGRAVFESLRVEVRHKKWPPYTHCIMEGART